MEDHAYVIRGAPKYLSNLGRGQLFDLPELERFAVLIRQTGKTVL